MANTRTNSNTEYNEGEIWYFLHVDVCARFASQARGQKLECPSSPLVNFMPLQDKLTNIRK